ncbi:hypothetical protein BHE74_00010030 [Ensete ventricosum]|uniref:Uncharacterized protein n=1 Tax=Ensete ventricosum TaxID=4639 RepID=A0A444FQE2_ENSVE|nr:hypothetical protein GW17_00010849 [Ensete ventricosum]RWW81561.1 hypothetical protein BHE74_00010030 [Ensete ventricosum]RZR71971.1 hypothetical protein BHM03_00009206 [Ensete ventricosum]
MLAQHISQPRQFEDHVDNYLDKHRRSFIQRRLFRASYRWSMVSSNETLETSENNVQREAIPASQPKASPVGGTSQRVHHMFAKMSSQDRQVSGAQKSASPRSYLCIAQTLPSHFQPRKQANISPRLRCNVRRLLRPRLIHRATWLTVRRKAPKKG